MIVDTLRRLQAMVQKSKGGGTRDIPDPRGQFSPEVLLQLLQPNIMTSRDLLDQVFKREMGEAPSEEDYGDYPEMKIDDTMEQSPTDMQINKSLGAKKVIIL